MEEQPPYEPPEVWVADEENGGKFAKTNRPVAGPTHMTRICLLVITHYNCIAWGHPTA